MQDKVPLLSLSFFDILVFFINISPFRLIGVGFIRVGERKESQVLQYGMHSLHLW